MKLSDGTVWLLGRADPVKFSVSILFDERRCCGLQRFEGRRWLCRSRGGEADFSTVGLRWVSRFGRNAVYFLRCGRLIVGLGRATAKARTTAGPFDKLRAGSSTRATRIAQDDNFVDGFAGYSARWGRMAAVCSTRSWVFGGWRTSNRYERWRSGGGVAVVGAGSVSGAGGEYAGGGAREFDCTGSAGRRAGV